MWKRIQGYGREKEKQIGHPALLETTYDEDQLRHMPSVADAQNAHQPNSQPPEHSAYSYPQHSHYSNHQPRPDVPLTSSAHFQSSPEPQIHQSYVDNQTMAADISPPSTPDPDEGHHDPTEPRRFRSMRDVSPVDESRAQRANRSNIPVLKRAPPGVRDSTPPTTQKFWGGKVAPSGKVRWDEYSGEPTASNAGKAGQVNPLSFARESLTPPSARKPVAGQPSAPIQEANTSRVANFSDRPSRAGARPTPVDTTLGKPREPWKGASGRVEIVQPFKTKPAQQSPLEFQKKIEPKVTKATARSVSSPVPSPVQRVPASADTAPVADGPVQFHPHEEPIKPIVPLKVGVNSPTRSIASPTILHNPVKPTIASPSPLRPAQTASFNLNPSTPPRKQPATRTIEEEHSESRLPDEPSTPANTKVPRKSIENTPGSTASKDNGPTSRFSWTTYNTSTTYQHSPPPSPPPPLPTTVQAVEQKPMPAATTILNRHRPAPVSDKATTRKPLTTGTATISTPSSPPSPRPNSTFSTNTQKALPRPPTELSAADHVDILEAQMEDLRIRRSNVHRLLQDLYNMAPPNPLITDFRRMRLVEKRKKEFEDELAEIKAEEHDVGLRLHRAYRKREKADPGSESAIWIRRVTR